MDFLSDEWVAAMDSALKLAGADEAAAEHLGAVNLVIQHRITGGADYYMSLGTDLAVAHGVAADPDVVFEQDLDTAAGIASGQLGAHDAVLTGRLVVAGNIAAIRERAPELANLTSVFDAVRADTSFSLGDSGSRSAD